MWMTQNRAMIGLNKLIKPAITRAAVKVYMVQPLRGVKPAARPPLMPSANSSIG